MAILPQCPIFETYQTTCHDLGDSVKWGTSNITCQQWVTGTSSWFQLDHEAIVVVSSSSTNLWLILAGWYHDDYPRHSLHFKRWILWLFGSLARSASPFPFQVTLATTTLASRLWRNPISFVCTERVWRGHSTSSCVRPVASTVVICRRPWRPMTWCPGSSSHMPRLLSSILAHRSLRCPPAFCWRWRKTALRASMTPWNNVHWSPNQFLCFSYHTNTELWFRSSVKNRHTIPEMSLHPVHVHFVSIRWITEMQIACDYMSLRSLKFPAEMCGVSLIKPIWQPHIQKTSQRGWYTMPNHRP